MTQRSVDSGNFPLTVWLNVTRGDIQRAQALRGMSSHVFSYAERCPLALVASDTLGYRDVIVGNCVTVLRHGKMVAKYALSEAARDLRDMFDAEKFDEIEPTSVKIIRVATWDE